MEGPDLCLNCGTPLRATDRYCPGCGQDRREKVLPFTEVLLDILRDSFSFDSRFLHSLPSLILRPGRLTRAFMAGQRARYIPAVRLYIFSSLVAFALTSLGGTPRHEERAGRTIREQAVSAPVRSTEEDGIDLQLSDPRSAKDQERIVRAIDSLGVQAWSARYLEQGPLYLRFLNKILLIDHQDRSAEVVDRAWRDLPLVFLFAIPLLALLIKGAYPRTFYVVHLVFSFHFGAFLMSSVAVLHLLGLVVGWTIKGILFLIAPVYFLIGLRRVYQRSWALTFLGGVPLLLLMTAVLLIVMALAFVVVVTTV
ncbi:MAG: DUF3667 domain-containing protein [Flavobacteriales bacterium]|nr:DUF3667 domain-containing protein [Flavobacteriales bacterium]MCB9168585.1 DUF3667 domain-containing protein [Flavobacteriales bacterium]